jgi:hypothetical protein
MALFRQSPDRSAIKDRDAAKANVDRLAARLSETHEAVATSRDAAQSRALSGDDGGLDAAEVAESAALRRLSTITGAHAEAVQVLLKLESQIAATLDKNTRAATVAATNAIADELARAAAGFDIAVAALADTSSRATLIAFEATGLVNFSASARLEVPAAVAVVTALLGEHAKMVLSGMAPATLPQPVAGGAL